MNNNGMTTTTPVSMGTYRATGDLKLCYNGMHASKRIIDAFENSVGSILCRVTCGGDIILSDDKLCSEWRRVEWMVDATELLYEFACSVTEDIIKEEVKEPNPLYIKLIGVRRAWLAGNATDSDLRKAHSELVSATNSPRFQLNNWHSYGALKTLLNPNSHYLSNPNPDYCVVKYIMTMRKSQIYYMSKKSQYYDHYSEHRNAVYNVDEEFEKQFQKLVRAAVGDKASE